MLICITGVEFPTIKRLADDILCGLVVSRQRFSGDEEHLQDNAADDT